MNIKYNTLTINLTSITTDETITENVPCGTCTFCCERLSPFLTPDEISSGIYPISLVQPTPEELLNNIGPKVVLFMNSNRGCSMLINGKCTIYENRPLACRQFDCRKQHHPLIPDMTIK